MELNILKRIINDLPDICEVCIVTSSENYWFNKAPGKDKIYICKITPYPEQEFFESEFVLICECSDEDKFRKFYISIDKIEMINFTINN